MTDFKIEKNIPPPENTHRWRMLAKEMRPGDSIFFKKKQDRNRFYTSAACLYRKSEFKVVSRSENGGWRIWLVGR